MSMARGTEIKWSEDEDIIGAIQHNGTIAGAARFMNVPVTSLKSHIDRIGARKRVDEILAAATAARAKASATRAASTPPPEEANAQDPGVLQGSAGSITVTLPASAGDPKLGDYASLLIERGLEPSDWTVTSLKANKWNAMTSDKATGDNRIVEMHQWTVVLKPAAKLVMWMPAVHVPRVKQTRVGPPASEKPVTIVVESDHQIPYNDERLHNASVSMLRDLYKKHRLSEQIYLGDTMDLPTISRHPDHPAAAATPKACVQGAYNMLREKRETAPDIRVRKLLGNHDWRIQGEQLARAERMYGLAPAQRWEDEDEPSAALHVNNLLHLPELGIELVEDPRGWQHAEVEIVPGVGGLVGRHGWLTGENTAGRSLSKRGRSLIVGHTHKREHVFQWDPSTGVERQAVVCGTMSLCRDERFPHFAVLDNWLPGLVVVTVWPDTRFTIEHAGWTGDHLRWRDLSWVG